MGDAEAAALERLLLSAWMFGAADKGTEAVTAGRMYSCTNAAASVSMELLNPMTFWMTLEGAALEAPRVEGTVGREEGLSRCCVEYACSRTASPVVPQKPSTKRVSILVTAWPKERVTSRIDSIPKERH